jgi:transposase
MKLLSIVAVVLLAGGAATSAQTLDDLKNDGKNTDNILTYGMGYHQNRYSPLKQIDKTNIKRLVPIWSAEDKIRIVLEGLRGEDSIAELCRREGIVQNPYYRWSKDFLEAGKKRLAGDTARAATSDEVKDLRRPCCNVQLSIYL